MIRTSICLSLALTAAVLAAAPRALAGDPNGCVNPYAGGCANGYCAPAGCNGPPSCFCCGQKAAYMGQFTNWHGCYYDVAWGTPVALVLPPNVGHQTKWSWGVANTEVVPISHQFGRAYPGPYAGGAGFLPTPAWPSHTDQFGVYYVRGPW